MLARNKLNSNIILALANPNRIEIDISRGYLQSLISSCLCFSFSFLILGGFSAFCDVFAGFLFASWRTRSVTFTRRRFLVAWTGFFLPLHSSILKPGLYLGFVQAQRLRKLCAVRRVQILLFGERFLQNAQLKIGEDRARFSTSSPAWRTKSRFNSKIHRQLT